MKDKKAHDHKGTKKLKIALFSITMMLPLIAVIPNMIYYAFNEKANNETTNITYIAKTNEVNNVNDLIQGNIYHFSYDMSNITTATTYLVGYSIHNINTINGSITSIYGNGTNRLSVYKGGTNHTTHYIGYSGNNIAIAYTETGLFDCDIVYYSYANVIPIEAFSKCENIPITSVEQETNIISKSINKAINNVWEWDIFNWTTNNDIHTTINNMTTGLGITSNTYIANILTYWFIITVIYIIFDVIIELFTYLTHLLFKGKDLND